MMNAGALRQGKVLMYRKDSGSIANEQLQGYHCEL
jgi:hypothetical protein